jgi:hypothetical protein
MSLRRVAALAATASLPAVTLAGLLATGAAPALAATSASCDGGGFTATMTNGAIVRPGSTAKAATGALTADSRIAIRGRYVEFDYAPLTGNIYNYVYTGAANPMSMTPGVRTPVWASKTLDLGPTLKSDVEVRADGTDLLMLSRGAGGKVKITAKDCASGGVFQQEAEAGRPVVATHTLAPGMYFYTNPYTGKINLGNGTDFRGKDSPQVATRRALNASVSVWEIASGGRMGFVTGEDAVELSTGATACVQDCQAQNQLRGSVDVTDPAFSG